MEMHAVRVLAQFGEGWERFPRLICGRSTPVRREEYICMYNYICIRIY